MNPKTLLFCAFIAQVLCFTTAQNVLPVNVLNPLNIGKSPLTTYVLDEYLKNATTVSNSTLSYSTLEDATVTNNSTWAILVAGSSGWDNYR